MTILIFLEWISLPRLFLLVRIVGDNLERPALDSGRGWDPDGAGGPVLLPGRGALVQVHRKNLGKWTFFGNSFNNFLQQSLIVEKEHGTKHERNLIFGSEKLISPKF